MPDELLRQTFATLFTVAGTLTIIAISALLVVWAARHRD